MTYDANKKRANEIPYPKHASKPADPDQMIKPGQGPNSSLRPVKYKQQWCYRCGAVHDRHE